MLDTKPQDEIASIEVVRTLRWKAMQLTRGSVGDADDLVQDTLERALRHLHRFDQGTNLVGWLATIMKRLAIDRHRRDSRRRLVPLDVVLLWDSLLDPGSEDEGNDPPAATAALADPARLTDALAQLPTVLRSALELHVHGGLAYAEIARRLSLPVSTVGTRIHRARALLRTLMDPAKRRSGPAKRRSGRPTRRKAPATRWRPSQEQLAG